MAGRSTYSYTSKDGLRQVKCQATASVSELILRYPRFPGTAPLRSAGDGVAAPGSAQDADRRGAPRLSRARPLKTCGTGRASRRPRAAKRRRPQHPGLPHPPPCAALAVTQERAPRWPRKGFTEKVAGHTAARYLPAHARLVLWRIAGCTESATARSSPSRSGQTKSLGPAHSLACRLPIPRQSSHLPDPWQAAQVTEWLRRSPFLRITRCPVPSHLWHSPVPLQKGQASAFSSIVPVESSDADRRGLSGKSVVAGSVSPGSQASTLSLPP